jgi:hypothetical protein
LGRLLPARRREQAVLVEGVVHGMPDAARMWAGELR